MKGADYKIEPMTKDPRAQAEYERLRRKMVSKQLVHRGIRDVRVLDVMESLPREQFVPPKTRGDAYEDRALPIDHGQTISQPYIVAYMTEQLSPTSSHRVLEVGTGSGYQTAVVCRLCAHVYTIERIAPLQEAAAAPTRPPRDCYGPLETVAFRRGCTASRPPPS